MTDFELVFNGKSTKERLSALKGAKASGLPPFTGKTVEHIHSTYSFSPYSPAAAAFMARKNGAVCAGIVDHDTLAGAEEFSEACEMLDMKPLLGLECRVLMDGTGMEDRKTNNPDQAGLSYVTMQRVPLEKAAFLTDCFAPLCEKRLIRERAITEKASALFPETDLSFDRDVLPLSLFSLGGTVTERHVLFALAKRLEEKYGREEELFSALNNAGVTLSPEKKAALSDYRNEFFLYDLTHAMKGELMEKIYVPASGECLTLRAFADLADKAGAVSCYAYLGDVKNSVTGDKKDGKFEDEYLPELLKLLKSAGIKAVTHSKKRNTPEQTERLLRLCANLG
ncbi:MAG: PHP domain-containing protein, partial [Oscillospiraceae bacterium]|nr:PHP domain-containing protein [Oscillospiraceae bacterium]